MGLEDSILGMVAGAVVDSSSGFDGNSALGDLESTVPLGGGAGFTDPSLTSFGAEGVSGGEFGSSVFAMMSSINSSK